VLAAGHRLLGEHKTWRGLAAAMLAGALVAPWLALPPWQGAVAGLLAIAGDACSSFLKRRLALPPGAWVPGLDQLPEAVLPLLLPWRALGLDLVQFAAAIAAFWVLDLVASRWIGSSRRRPAAPPRSG
jgi:CDP-2,3-bis-(O-geranylgeranyl)-sn-glycerol synthase